MRRHFQALLAAAAIGVALSAVAAVPDTGTGDARATRRADMKQRFFDRIDADHDGSISRDEYRGWVDSRFERLDINRDDTVDADEIANSPQVRERVRKRAQRFVKRFDASGSGKVSQADFEAKAMVRFDRLANGADTVSLDQFAMAGKQRYQHDSAKDPSTPR